MELHFFTIIISGPYRIVLLYNYRITTIMTLLYNSHITALRPYRIALLYNSHSTSYRMALLVHSPQTETLAHGKFLVYVNSVSNW